MACEPEIPCNLTPAYTLMSASDVRLVMAEDHGPASCYLCRVQKEYARTISCGANWPAGEVYGEPQPDWRGHGTSVYLMNHAPEPEDVGAALTAAWAWFQGERAGTTRGHYKLKQWGGHWGLERFESPKTTPHTLANVIARLTDEAVMWFFDPTKMLPDFTPNRRDRNISDEEVRRRIEKYRFFIDKEMQRPPNKAQFRDLPSLLELPEEHQRRLVQWWDRTWFNWLDLHLDWRWTPRLGFWRVEEKIYPLAEEAHG